MILPTANENRRATVQAAWERYLDRLYAAGDALSDCHPNSRDYPEPPPASEWDPSTPAAKDKHAQAWTVWDEAEKEHARRRDLLYRLTVEAETVVAHLRGDEEGEDDACTGCEAPIGFAHEEGCERKTDDTISVVAEDCEP